MNGKQGYFRHRVAVITGAGSGIGRALAQALAEQGAYLALCDIDAGRLRETERAVREAGADCLARAVDVSRSGELEVFAGSVIDRYGGVEMLVNNAGVTVVDSVEHMRLADAEWLMNINFWGVVHGTKMFLPALLAADRAHVVNVSSMLGLCAAPLQAMYSASKFAVRGFTDALEIELAETSVRVHGVYPGAVRTNITDSARLGAFRPDLTHEELGREFEKRVRTTAEEAATRILDGVRRGRRRILVGGDARIADWIARLLPARYERLLGFRRGLQRGPLRGGSKTPVNG